MRNISAITAQNYIILCRIKQMPVLTRLYFVNCAVVLRDIVLYYIQYRQCSQNDRISGAAKGMECGFSAGYKQEKSEKYEADFPSSI